MDTSAHPTGITPNKLELDPNWTAIAAKTVYSESLKDARQLAARGQHDAFSAGAIATLHLLNVISDIQYQAFQNETRFLEARFCQRLTESTRHASR